ncbi:MAG: TetR/AcrR family transcriptional regulator [Coriobacteriia bacterium]
MAPRPANPHLRHDILAAAVTLVEEQGHGSVTMRAVADRIGYSPTTIYLYFKCRDDLLDQTVNHAFEIMTNAIASAESGSTPSRIRQTGRAYVAWALDNPNMYRLMFEHGYLGDTTPEAIQARRSGLRRLGELVAQGRDEGLNIGGEVPVQQLIYMAWATLHGIASLAISGRMFGNPGEMIPLSELRDRALSLATKYSDLWMAPELV